ncbi:DUF3536 domain-containing protein [Maridesulfovibrio ferrireducens]|uniref:DUF3536 domain-containing protein n=1 Tax=Maridesulfovibrio ferrireducens TaxID=246191 RepID=UPI001A1F5858|nr:DUF3536 domain-containing protein [Maridesulfovibrio ferrireducens]MBI9111430.1 DUF3536 domain-containing protein [Maridesulfovibrio ferrireducens]
MSGKFLCVHGHFYQPPREDPWLDMIFPEGSAAPFRHWNERICSESYGPLAWARRMGDKGIFDIINCYEWMSFNVGPTLFRWIERAEPELYAKIIEADAKSIERWGHGNAIAQIYHHVIMPLASDLDKETEVAWAIADFESRFNRKPEGMWLSETACNTASLEALAAQGVVYTLLAPRQAEALAELNSNDWHQVDEGSLNIKEPYLVELPSGKTISVFFYDGGLSQAVAFEGLLKNGEDFWNKLSGASGEGLLSIGTDGETYGHHFEFGEMALAYVLSQGATGRDDLNLTNYGAYLAQNPPTRKVKIRENSSWSCYHGVERWRSDCGCCTGGHDGWNQQWRKPLRDGLNEIKTLMDKHFFAVGKNVFNDSREALVEYGAVLSGSINQADFFKLYFKCKEGSLQADLGWKLLSMQKWALSSFASCGWFFDDLARLEPLNDMSFVLRAMEIAESTGLIGLEEKFLQIMAEAKSNEERYGSGVDLWNSKIKPQKDTSGSLIAQGLIRLSAEGAFPVPGEEGRVDWPGASVSITLESNLGSRLKGEAAIRWSLESAVNTYKWEWTKEPSVISGEVQIKGIKNGYSEVFKLDQLSWKKRQSLSMAWVKRVSDNSWDRKLLPVIEYGPDIFLGYEDYQSTQIWVQKWKELWSPLVWTYLFTDVLACDDFMAFIKETGRDHPDSAALTERMSITLCDMLHNQVFMWDKVVEVLRKAKTIEFSLNIWKLQNCYWDKAQNGTVSAELSELLGFDL